MQLLSSCNEPSIYFYGKYSICTNTRWCHRNVMTFQLTTRMFIQQPWKSQHKIKNIKGQHHLPHDDKHFRRYWPFVRGIPRSPVNSPHKGQRCGALMLSLIHGWVNNREAGDLGRHLAHYDVIVMHCEGRREGPVMQKVFPYYEVTFCHSFLWSTYISHIYSPCWTLSHLVGLEDDIDKHYCHCGDILVAKVNNASRGPLLLRQLTRD